MNKFLIIGIVIGIILVGIGGYSLVDDTPSTEIEPMDGGNTPREISISVSENVGVAEQP